LYPPEILRLIAPVTAVEEPARQGTTSQVTFAKTGLGALAIKRATGERLAALRREKQILEALAGIDLPIPEWIHYVEVDRGSHAEGWLVMRRLPGQPLEQALQQMEQARARNRLLHGLGAMVAQLHAHPVPPVLAETPEQWLDSMLGLAEACLRIGQWDGNRAHLDALKQRRFVPTQPKLIHGDLFLDNVLTDGEAITGIIDWAFCAAGDPRYDLVLASHELDIAGRQAFLKGYGLTEGLDESVSGYYLDLARFC
jgi:aminoglycoside phosphotransferase (APT) family kinase protein